MATTITHNGSIAEFGGEDHLELSQQISFPEMIFRLLSEQKPTPNQLKLFELILNLSIDHGPDTPSAKKTIEAAQKGEPISEAVAEGIKEINDSHGGAIEPCMKVLYEMTDNELSAEDVVKKFLASDMKLPGFGHRIYKVDPRAQLILTQIEKLPSGSKYVKLVRDLESQLNDQTGKQLPINIDGAIAAALCAFAWEARLGKAVFIIARVPGLCAHYLNNS